MTQTELKNDQYQYQYGVKNIEISSYEQKDKGIFVSKPIEINGLLSEVELETDESHPLFSEIRGFGVSRFTSIEYYVTEKENPDLQDWVSILPNAEKEVKCERLFLNGSTATLRFMADMGEQDKTTIFKNGIKLKENEWFFLEEGSKVFIKKKYANAIYTIDYVASSRNTCVSTFKVNEERVEKIKKVERFKEGADRNNSIYLSEFPYTKNEHTIKVSIYSENMQTADGVNRTIFKDVTESEDGYGTKDVTNYKDTIDVALKPYSIVEPIHTVFEYKVDRNKISFTESFNYADLFMNEDTNHGNGEIEVVYTTLKAKLRLKVIIRKNTSDRYTGAPTVNEIKIKTRLVK